MLQSGATEWGGCGLADADVVALLTDHSVFAEISPELLASKSVVDSRGLWERTGHNH